MKKIIPWLLLFAMPLQADDTVYLDQGWDHKTRQQLSFTSFGSRIIPYDWFMTLEQPGSTRLLRDNNNMRALGFITTVADDYNPDGLPVGVVRDRDRKNGDYVGLTCAACHTGQVSINGKRIRIDGGQALIDYTGFEQQILASLKSTVNDNEKFSRFSVAINERHNADKNIDSLTLTAQIKKRIAELEERFAVNATDVPYGHGRLDAFGQIFNAIAVEALAMPENTRMPNAPTSYPVLWDASHLNIVQWNASAPNKEPGPLFQNAITALAVYGTVSIHKDKTTYPSSIRISNLGDIQRDFYQLVAPKWPTELAGGFDQTKIAAGKKLYDQHCLECHTYVDPTHKKRKLRAVLTPYKEVGTDPLMVENFTQHKVKSGILEGEKAMVLFGDKLPAETSPLDLVTHAATGALLNQPWQTTKALFKEYRSNDDPPQQTVYNSYKARPINGVWASAPYLHNGSVPTIYDLLLPAAQRPVSFYVGNTELDLIKVGHQSHEAPNTSFFNTQLPGNSNAGHEYGTQLSEDERWALVEYVKSL
ncbi:di-heme-cytochrome C peroxidase [Cellvibrio sp. pealriver]|uniref:di-heme-cytochrome C peroxidase n=1 Tax=Cellvibrio sp. pealriver TaxID=1622269 RepID=UPI00069E4272|nr:di-heme-cytochrome C peroxidase [Cellvibrio sp. pealriver]